MITQVNRDLHQLTDTIKDASSKTHLRPVVFEQLVKLNHAPKDVDAALDEFFKVVVH